MEDHQVYSRKMIGDVKIAKTSTSLGEQCAINASIRNMSEIEIDLVEMTEKEIKTEIEIETIREEVIKIQGENIRSMTNIPHLVIKDTPLRHLNPNLIQGQIQGHLNQDHQEEKIFPQRITGKIKTRSRMEVKVTVNH